MIACMNPLPPSATSNLLVVGGTPSERREAARSLGMPGGRPDAYTLVELPARTLAFQRVAGPPATPTRPRIIRIDELHLAFHDRQTGGTRLVLTQSSYLLQKWLDVLGPEDRIIATAERDLLAAVAPEALKGTGPWRAFCIADVDEVCDDGLGPNVSAESSQSSTVEQDHVSAILADAYESAATAQRVELCREAVAADSSSATARLALASAC